MPRLSQSLPKYRKHKASGLAVVTLNGVDHYLGPHGTKDSKVQYDRAIAEWLQSKRQLQPNGGSAITVVEVCARFLQFADAYYVKDGKRTGTTQGFKASIKYLRKWYGRDLAVDFGPLALRAVQQRMADDGLSRPYVNDHIARIKRMFRWAVAEELLPPATFQALSAVSGLAKGRSTAKETAPILPVEDAAVDATLPHLPEVPADMVRLQRLTGMRPAEVCIVRPCDIDRTDEVWLYRPASHKTEHHGRERIVFIGREGQTVLLKYLEREPATYCFRPCESEERRRAEAHAARKTPLSCGNRPGTNRRRRARVKPGERYTTTAYRRAITRACDKAFPHPQLASKQHDELSTEDRAALQGWQRRHRWAPNRLRHTFATKVRRLHGLEASQIVLGHSSADVTQIYAERDLAKGIAVAKAIG